MKKFLLMPILLITVRSYSQNFVQTYKDRADLVTQTNINTNLNEFASYGIKKTGTTANNNAAIWLQSKYTSLGYSASEIKTQSFNTSIGTTKNVIVTKTGTTFPNTFIIICGHYDTVNGPGVNDNGSGVAAILEAARILKDVPTEYSIKFINFSGEEQGLLGSTAYVTSVVKATNPRMDIKLVLNLDQIGGVAGFNNVQINVERDGTPSFPAGMYSSNPSSNNAASAVVSAELSQNIINYSTISPVNSYVERSDYMPFEAEGYVVTGLYETKESTRPHTSNDTYVNMDPVFLYKVTKGIVGAIQYFAVANTDLFLSTINTKKDLKDRVVIFPNPANDYVNLGLDGKGYSTTVVDMTGKVVMQSKDQQVLNTSKLKAGAYLVKVTTKSESTAKKLIIKK